MVASQGSLKTRIVSLSLLTSLLTGFVPVSLAYAGDCDGTAGDDNILCSTDPLAPDSEVGLDFGNDTYVQDAGVTSVSVGGDAEPDGSQNTGDGGDDHITINGTVILCVDGDQVDGNGGNDTIIINGEVQCELTGDYVTGNGGNDHLIVNGEVDSDVKGDSADGDGGDDTIIINGSVGGDVFGDFADLDGGDDVIIINGSVVGDIFGDDVFGAGGNDTVTLGVGASVGGLIDGEGGFDTLKFAALTAAQVLGLDPAGGTITIGGNTFVWQNFEELIGLLVEAGARLIYRAGSLFALDQPTGIAVFAEHGRIAFISYAVVDAMAFGEALTFSTPNAAGWFVIVTKTGVNPDNPANFLYQVNIFAPSSTQVGSFIFSN